MLHSPWVYSQLQYVLSINEHNKMKKKIVSISVTINSVSVYNSISVTINHVSISDFRKKATFTFVTRERGRSSLSSDSPSFSEPMSVSDDRD